MLREENECQNCGLTCMGKLCPHNRVARYYCDGCGEEYSAKSRIRSRHADELLYEFDGQQLCINCILERLTAVEE